MSLVVQWLGASVLQTGCLGLIPGQGTRFHMMHNQKILHITMKIKNPTGGN